MAWGICHEDKQSLGNSAGRLHAYGPDHLADALRIDIARLTVHACAD